MWRGAAGLLIGLALGGCASTAYPDHPTWNRGLCGRDARAVTTPWDARLEAVFARVAAVAGTDMGQGLRMVVAVDALDRGALATMCVRGVVTTVLVTVAALERAEPDDWLAWLLGHELAHAALRHATHGDPARELEADELGMYYATRAGYDCRRGAHNAWAAQQWPDPAKYRAEVAAACEQARRGVRPPRRFAG